VPDACETRRDGGTHSSHSGDSDFHLVKTTLVSIPTDTIPLDGAWYEPAGGKTRGAALLFHGNTMNFYMGAPRFLPPVLAAMGYASLAFNRRGHDILGIRNSRCAEGAAFQTYAEAIQDNAIAARWVEERGFPDPVVIGHSNGGLLAAQHVADHPRTPLLALLSAHCGGQNMVPLASKIGVLAQDRLEEITREATERVRQGRGRELMFLPGWWYVTTAESFLDTLTRCPDLLELAPRISCPVLYLRGDKEHRDLYPAEEFARRARGPCEVQIVPHCDHFYVGREEEIAGRVTRWLSHVLKRA
jgi:pimeloyl-ACP methyl ester carboxylesterase